MALTTKLELLVTMLEAGQALAFETPANNVRVERTIDLPEGTDEGQIDLLWCGHFEFTAAQEQDLDLTSLTGAFGETVTFVRLSGLLCISTAPNWTSCQVSRPVNGVPFMNAVGDAIGHGGRGMVVWIAHRGSPPGVPVTPSTGHLLHLTGGISPSTFDLVLLGTSA